jgi:hypothetical protein
MTHQAGFYARLCNGGPLFAEGGLCQVVVSLWRLDSDPRISVDAVVGLGFCEPAVGDVVAGERGLGTPG